MVKWLIRVLVLIIIGLGAVLLVRDDPGFVLVKYRSYSVETSLAFGIVALILSVSLVHLVVRLLRGLWRLPYSMQRYSQTRRFDKSRKLLNQGLIDLAEGRFDQAEVNLIKMVEFSESPLLHYLAAARAAQLQGKHDARDSYLKAAHEARPEAEIAIGVTQAELQLEHQQNEQSLATLNHLRDIAPRHDYILMLLARVYTELEDWSSLVDLLPEIRKKKLFKESKLKEMEHKGYKGYLHEAAAKSDRPALEKAWGIIPNSLQADPELIIDYVGILGRQDFSVQHAEQLVVNALNRQWDDRLAEIYGLFSASNVNEQLKQAEKWLADYDQNEHLLLALGRICIRAKLWGKAQGYLEASIGVSPLPATCLALAELFSDHLQQPDKAAKFYQQGLEYCVKDNI
ncbi:MAG: tetratricopeptide repeat protein [Proteobacteria bacterium]|nr:tetratricopeptide repeat protein [Pseudomonadota bacterium]